MQPNLKPEESVPLIEVIDTLVRQDLHAAAWEICSGKAWYFGNASNSAGSSRFWKMDLGGVPGFDAIWEHSRGRCEALAGAPLEVVRQYANGHTYGLGGEPHVDDKLPGTFTLLYYPNPEWKSNWDGETVFFDQDGEIALAVKPKPNRGVFFDSRILHAGRAPSRNCPVLRVTVAFKLRVTEPKGPFAVAVRSAPPAVSQDGIRETKRDGSKRIYEARIGASRIAAAVEEKIAALACSVRLPGYHAGQIPREVLEQRYGAEAKTQVLKAVGAQLVEKALPEGSVAFSCELSAGTPGGDVDLKIAATHLPDLPEMDLNALVLEQLAPLELRTLDPAQVDAFCQQDLKTQVLDFLHESYTFPLFPGKVEREFAAIWKSAQENGLVPEGQQERDALAPQLRAIAERRLRLAFVIQELARRFGFTAQPGAELEDLVVSRLLQSALLLDRQVSFEELRRLMGLTDEQG